MKNPSTETSESEVIRSDIEQTRESMDRTLDKIGERMRPRHLLDQFLDFFRSQNSGTVSETAGSVLTSVSRGAERAANGIVTVAREHPVPTILIGAGITWAVIESRRRHSNGNGHAPKGGEQHWDEVEAYETSGIETVPHVSSAVGEKISSTAASTAKSLKEKGQKLGQRISESARAVGRSAQRGYTTSRTKFVEASETHPIAVGVGFLAAGVLLGLTLPHSRKEDQWLGPTADRTKEQAKQQVKAKAQDLLERSKQVASAATSAATQAAKETAQQQGLTTGQVG